jgi:hypothetical protein
MPRRASLAIVPALAVSLLLAACGASAAPPASDAAESDAPAASVAPSAAPSESGAPQSGTDLDACELVTAADVEAALALEAGTVAAGELTEDPTTLSPGHTSCRYSGDWGGLVVSLTPEDGANLFDASRGSYADASDREVSGADGAFWSEDQGRGFFWKGAVAVMLQITHLTAGGDFGEATVAIGQAAMDRVD